MGIAVRRSCVSCTEGVVLPAPRGCTECVRLRRLAVLCVLHRGCRFAHALTIFTKLTKLTKHTIFTKHAKYTMAPTLRQATQRTSPAMPSLIASEPALNPGMPILGVAPEHLAGLRSEAGTGQEMGELKPRASQPKPSSRRPRWSKPQPPTTCPNRL